MLELFARRRDFRQLFLAHAVSRAGDAFNAVALVVLVLELTDSSLGVAGAVAFEVVAVLLFGVVAGLFVDRYPRREVMVIADLTRAVLVGALAVFSGSLVLAFVVAFGVSLGGVVFNPAAASLVPETVTRNELVRANATLWATGVTLQIAMAPLAGVLIATVGVGAAFAVNAASFAGSAILLVGLRAGRTPASMEPVGWRAALAGVHEVRAHPLLRRLSVAQLLAALSAGATSGLLVVLARERLGTDSAGFGFLLGAIGVGAVAGTLLLARHTPGSTGMAVWPARRTRPRRPRPGHHDQPRARRRSPRRLRRRHLDRHDCLPVDTPDRDRRRTPRTRVRVLRHPLGQWAARLTRNRGRSRRCARRTGRLLRGRRGPGARGPHRFPIPAPSHDGSGPRSWGPGGTRRSARTARMTPDHQRRAPRRG